MATNLEKLRGLLQELFQLDQADLDFGIYRIMNHKRYEIQRFITEDLPAAVAHELDRDAYLVMKRREFARQQAQDGPRPG